jgi:hypothetical protein
MDARGTAGLQPRWLIGRLCGARNTVFDIFPILVVVLTAAAMALVRLSV